MSILFFLLGIFSGGLFLLDVVLLGGATVLFLYARKQQKSGSVIGGSSSDPIIRDGGGNLPLYKIVSFWFSMALLAAWVVTIIARASDI